MPASDANGTCTCDVAVVGAGAVGLTLALRLAKAGFATVLVGPAGARRPGRTVALLEGSVRLLESLGVWDALAPRTAPLRRMRLVDATGSLFRTAPVEFVAAEIGRQAFGFNIGNDDLEAGLAAAASRTKGLFWIETTATGFDRSPSRAVVEAGPRGCIDAALVVAADGRRSLARKMARIGVRQRAWPQIALTALMTHEASHADVSTEFHTRQGPFTLVPLPNGTDGGHRSSLVWVMAPGEAARRRALAPQAFADAATRQADRLLGRMAVIGDVGAFPIVTSTAIRLTGPRLVLAGEAAHALPPIGAQGLNLSLRDVAVLATHLEAARAKGEDIGSGTVLDRYAAAREGDTALRTSAVDMLNGALLSRSPFVDLLRGAGLAALGAIGPLRRAAMREGLVPGGDLPADPLALAPVRSSDGLDGPDEHRRSTHQF